MQICNKINFFLGDSKTEKRAQIFLADESNEMLTIFNEMAKNIKVDPKVYQNFISCIESGQNHIYRPVFLKFICHIMPFRDFYKKIVSDTKKISTSIDNNTNQQQPQI